MQGRNENILSSDKIIAFQKKLAIWKKRIAAGNLEMVPSTLKSNCLETAPLILNHLDTLLKNLDKYFPSISIDQYDWIKSPFVEFEPPEGQFTLTEEEEELASITSDRILKLKHSELSLNVFWLLVEKEYPAIAQKALRLLLFSTSYLSEFGFSALTAIKHKKQAQLLSVENELRVSVKNDTRS